MGNVLSFTPDTQYSTFRQCTNYLGGLKFDTAVCCYCKAEFSAVYSMSPRHIPGLHAHTVNRWFVSELRCIQQMKWKESISSHAPSHPLSLCVT